MTFRSISRRSFLKISAAGATMATGKRGALASSTHAATIDAELLSLDNTHDLPSLSNWGPYSKKLYGISHIPDLEAGLLFDLSIFPTLDGASVRLPNVTDQCGVHPWQASSDLTYYATRTELLWKNQVYCDHAYVDAGPTTRLIRMELVNNTLVPQRVTLHALSQLCFPPLQESTAQPIRRCEMSLPPSAAWTDAVAYEDMRFAVPRPTDTLVPDGRWRGEERMHEAVGGSVLDQGFGRDAGDTALYKITTQRPLKNAVLLLRFRTDAEKTAVLRCTGLIREDVALHGTGEFSIAEISVGSLSAGDHTLRLTTSGGTRIALNGFVIVEQAQSSLVKFLSKPWQSQPKIEAGPNGSILLKYADINSWYGFTLGQPAAAPQLVPWRDLDRTFGAESGPNTHARIFGRGKDGLGDPDSPFVRTSWPVIELPPGSTRAILGLFATGTESRVRAAMHDFHSVSGAHKQRWRSSAARAVTLSYNPQAQPHIRGQQLLAATTLCNVVYPQRTQGQTIRHYSPGKIWDCLYTWDSGFIGLGLLELDTDAALACLNTYLTPPGSQSAFIHHGSPLPTQIYLFMEIWNRTQSAALLRHYYPRLRQFYLFLAGRLGSSTTRRHRDGLICTWDYFYNSGGWDDYPPQVYMHKSKLESGTAPTVSTSHLIRCARFLKLCAQELGVRQDIETYDTDIHELSASLQRDSWDEASGYFGYVTYSDTGKPDGILRTADGVNYNMGLDGVSPLIAGICSAEQREKLLDHLFSAGQLWTDAGIGTVDQRAPYYNPHGYWNGSVWFAHQWFLFKTMLDLGRGDLAIKIAQTGVETWTKSTDESYDCMEHFYPAPPRGAGWCQFSSLCSSALNWFSALYTPGRVTVGFDTWVCETSYAADRNALRLIRSPQTDVSAPACDILVCLSPATHYDVHANGQRIQFTEALPGLLRVTLPSDTHTLEVQGV